MDVPRKRRRWPWALAATVILLGGGVAVAGLHGGFERVEFQYRPVEIGQLLNLGPLEVTLLGAWAEADSFDPESVQVILRATCRNTTTEGAFIPNYLDHAMAIRDPVDLGYTENLELIVGPWDAPVYPQDALNPSPTAVQCRIRGTFPDGFSGGETVDVIAMPILPAETLWDTINSASWASATAHPYLASVPLEPAPGG